MTNNNGRINDDNNSSIDDYHSKQTNSTDNDEVVDYQSTNVRHNFKTNKSGEEIRPERMEIINIQIINKMMKIIMMTNLLLLKMIVIQTQQQ